MKACIITFEFPPQLGGISQAVNRIAKGLMGKGVEVHIVAVTPNHKDSFSVPGRLHMHRFGPFSGDLKNIPEVEGKRLMKYLNDLQKKHSFDLFHAFTIYPCGYIATKAAKQLNVPVIISARGEDGTKDLRSDYRIEDKRYTIRNSNLMTFVSQEMLDNVNNFESCKDKSFVLLNAIDSSEFYYLPKLEKPKVKGFVIGIASTIRETKGFEYLLEAFAMFSKRYESTLLLAGSFRTQEIKKRYTDLIQKLNIKDKVIMTGPIKHRFILNYINMMDVYVLPSIFSEGCPNSLLEAMYLGKPSICSKTGAIPEIIQDCVNGFLVDPKDIDGIYTSLIRLKEDHKLRKDMGTKAKDTISSRFSSKKETKRWADMYKKIIFYYDYFKILNVEINNTCNTDCIFCFNHSRFLREKTENNENLSLSDLKKIIENLREKNFVIERIGLLGKGEPILNPKFFEIISYLTDKDIAVEIITNLTLKHKNYLDTLVKEKVSSICLNLPACNSKTYEIIRPSSPKGEFDLVLENAKKIITEKKRLRIQNPKMVWKFIINRINIEDCIDAVKKAEEIGFNKIQFEKVHLGHLNEEGKEMLMITKGEENRIKDAILSINQKIEIEFKEKRKFTKEGRCILRGLVRSKTVDILFCCYNKNILCNLFESSLRSLMLKEDLGSILNQEGMCNPCPYKGLFN